MKAKKYFSDYAPTKSEEGKLNPKEFQYIGKYKTFDISKEKFYKFKLLTFILTCVIAFCFIVSGMVDSYSGRCAYVLIPYVITIFPILYLSMGVIKLGGCSNKFTRKQFDFSIYRIYHSVVAILFIDTCVCIGDIIMCLANYSDTNTNDLIFFFSQVIMLVATALLFKLYRSNLKLTKDLSSE